MWASTAFALFCTCLFLSACGGDKQPHSAPTPTGDASSGTTPPANQGVGLALLRASDLGEGWIEQDAGDFTVAKEYFCGELAPAFPPSETVILSNPQSGVAFLIQEVAEFTSETAAVDYMHTRRELMNGCSDYLSTDGVRRSSYVVTEAAVDDLGDDTLAMRASTTEEDRQTLGLSAFVRYDSVIMVVSPLFVSAAAAAQFEEILSAADAKFTASQSE